MSEKDQKQETGVENVEIEPLSDEALESVAGGDSSGSCCSCSGCSGSSPVCTPEPVT